MTAIRVLLSGLPPLLRDVLTEIIDAQPDMAVVAEAAAGESLIDLVREHDAQVVIVALDSEVVPAEHVELVARHSHLKVLAVGPEGRRAWLYELRPHQVLVGEVSTRGLLDVLRTSLTRELQLSRYP